VGIIASIARAVAAVGGTVDEVSQTVMRGYFTIILAARFAGAVTAEEVRAAIEREGQSLRLTVNVRDGAPDDPRPAADADLYVLTVQGEDHPGLIAQIATYLAAQGINIEDFYARAASGRFTMVFQIRVVEGWDANQVRLDLEAIGSETGLRAHLQHVDIFRVTSEVVAPRRLLRQRRSTPER
jgi:glycine cleavage system transcriptional repressor